MGCVASDSSAAPDGDQRVNSININLVGKFLSFLGAHGSTTTVRREGTGGQSASLPALTPITATAELSLSPCCRA